jgi:hypothetical protein
MRVRFNWREWWKAERFGVSYATGLSVLAIVVGIFFGITEGNWTCAIVGGVMLAWTITYGAGWQLLLGAVAWIRAKMGWITYSPLEPKDQQREEPPAEKPEAIEARSPDEHAPPPGA